MNVISRKKLFTTLAIILPVLCMVSGNKCTNVLSKSKIVEVVVKEPCLQKYEARCGWLSLVYCTFYHNTFCDKRVNETRTTYYIKTDCCKGFMLASNGSCIKLDPAVVYSTKTTPAANDAMKIVDPDHIVELNVDKTKIKETKMEITGGGYAGIACGLVLFVTIAAFIVIAVRKRKHKKHQKEARQAERVLYIGPTSGSQAIIRNPGCSRVPSIQITREETPSSSRMVTPPTSPMKTVLPVEVPLINQNLDDDIPESDV